MPNPFLDDIATDPRREAGSVAGLNDGALDMLLDAFSTLVQGTLPRIRSNPVKAQLVLSVEPGYGKSHLIGRLFEQLRGRATLVYLRPFASAEACWRSLLHRTVQELNYPDTRGAATTRTDAPTQLDAFACGVLSHLVATLIERGDLSAADVEASVAYLRKNPLDAFGLMAREHTWSDWLRVVIPQSYSAMAGELERTGIPARECLPWLRILFTLVLKRDNLELRNACTDWIAAVPLDDDVRQAIGLSAGDVAMQEDDHGLCRRRLVALGCLASYYRPFVLCFDQTDAYADNPELSKQFSHVAEFLLAEMPQQMTVVTANRAPWDEGIRPHFQDAQLARFRRTPISLEGINLRQARSLLQLRLEATETANLPQAQSLDDTWLQHVFQGRSEMAVRGLLRAASKRWEDEDAAADAGQTLQERYRSLVQKHLEPGSDLCRFNAETLWWLVQESAQGQCGLAVSRHEDHSYFTVRWQWDGRVRVFGFEGGANARRWSGIANRAWELHERGLGIRALMLRTPELPPIPAKSWAAVRQQLEAAAGKFLDIYVFDMDEIAQVHAARTLVEESIAGDIPFLKKQTVEFVRGKLRPLWEKLKAVGESVATPGHDAPKPATTPADGITGSNGTNSADHESNGDTAGDDMARRIVQGFAALNLEVRVSDCIAAPQLLRYRLHPGEGVRAVSLASRAKELQAALSLSEPPMIEAAPGHVTVDIPRSEPMPVPWSSIVLGPSTGGLMSPIAFPVGLGVKGQPVIADLANPGTCHMLVGGAAGSGKSEFLKTVVASLVSRNAPSSLRLAIMDPKFLTFGGIGQSPWLAHPVLSSLDEALILLRRSADEMEARCERLADEGFMNLRQRFEQGRTDVPFHVIIFDEFADLVLSGRSEKKDFEGLVSRIAAKGRAGGVHLILATQRPDRGIVSGLISANLPMKVCMKVAKDTHSRIILGEAGGESLLGRGDLLCDLGRGLVRCQSPIIGQEEFVALLRGK